MYIGLENIQQLFEQKQTVCQNLNDKNCLTGVVKLETVTTPYFNNVLYVCQWQEELKQIKYTHGMNLLCVYNNAVAFEQMTLSIPQYVNALFVKDDCYDAIIHELTAYFDIHCGVSMLSDTLLELLSDESGIQAMVDHAYEALGNPIFIFDAGFSLIAANWKEAKELNVGLDLIENKGFSKNEYKMITKHDRVHERVKKSEEPIAIYNNDIEANQLICTIDTKKDKGHIVVTAINRSFRTIDSQLLQILKKCINQQLKKDEFIRHSKGFTYEYYLKDLLDGNLLAGNSYKKRHDQIAKDFSGNLHCLVVDAELNSSKISVHYTRNMIEMCFPNAKTLVYNKKIIGVIIVPKSQNIQSNGINALKKICQEESIYAVISNVFHDIEKLSVFYKQISHMLQYKENQGLSPDLYLYEENSLEHLRQIFTQNVSTEAFLHPKMKLLIEYDQGNGTEFAFTLYMYLIHERNFEIASNAMHMHRNSLIYRIKKINALIGLTYETYYERQYLIMSYEVYHQYK